MSHWDGLKRSENTAIRTICQERYDINCRISAEPDDCPVDFYQSLPETPFPKVRNRPAIHPRHFIIIWMISRSRALPSASIVRPVRSFGTEDIHFLTKKSAPISLITVSKRCGQSMLFLQKTGYRQKWRISPTPSPRPDKPQILSGGRENLLNHKEERVAKRIFSRNPWLSHPKNYWSWKEDYFRWPAISLFWRATGGTPLDSSLS